MIPSDLRHPRYLKNTRCSEGAFNMKVRPLHDRVIVKRLEEDRTSPGGMRFPIRRPKSPFRERLSRSARQRRLAAAHAPICPFMLLSR
jgi:hypothetical protein